MPDGMLSVLIVSVIFKFLIGNNVTGCGDLMHHNTGHNMPKNS